MEVGIRDRGRERQRERETVREQTDHYKQPSNLFLKPATTANPTKNHKIIVMINIVIIRRWSLQV